MRALTLGLFATLLCSAAAADGVKMARTGACYAANDIYYSGIVPISTFSTMVDCVGAGGWDRAMGSYAARSIPGAPTGPLPLNWAAHGWVPEHISPYLEVSRAAQINEASSWIVGIGGCREIRDDLLSKSSRSKVAWSEDGCRVKAGVWTDAFTGAVITDPERVEIAHVMTPGWAEAHGASSWSPERRAAFYADPTNLITVSIESKTAWAGRSPMEWRPYDGSLACNNANAFATVAIRHGLAYNESEAYGMQAAIDATCVRPTASDIAAARADRQLLIEAQRHAIDVARGITERDALRSTNYPAPIVAIKDGKVLDETVVILPVTQSDPEQDNPQAGPGLAREEVSQALERPPIALPGVYVNPKVEVPVAVQPSSPNRNQTPYIQSVEERTKYLFRDGKIRLEDLRGIPINDLISLVEEDNVYIEGFNNPGERLDMERLIKVLQDDGSPPVAPVKPMPSPQTSEGMPEFDGDPAMMGLATPGASFTMGN